MGGCVLAIGFNEGRDSVIWVWFVLSTKFAWFRADRRCVKLSVGSAGVAGFGDTYSS